MNPKRMSAREEIATIAHSKIPCSRGCALRQRHRQRTDTRMSGHPALAGRGLPALSTGKFSGHDCSRRRHGIDPQREAIDLAHDDLFSGGNGDGGDGVPKLAVHEHFSGRR